MSKFGDILKNAKRAPEPDEAPAETPPEPEQVVGRIPEAVVALPAPPSPPPKMGRPPGKRSNPAFEQVTAYIPGELYRKVRIGLLEDAKGQEFSELVAELLAAWLAGRKSG